MDSQRNLSTGFFTPPPDLHAPLAPMHDGFQQYAFVQMHFDLRNKEESDRQLAMSRSYQTKIKKSRRNVPLVFIEEQKELARRTLGLSRTGNHDTLPNSTLASSLPCNAAMEVNHPGCSPTPSLTPPPSQIPFRASGPTSSKALAPLRERFATCSPELAKAIFDPGPQSKEIREFFSSFSPT